MFKFKKLWMGPEEKVFNEGFDELFSVNEEYRIPSPSSHTKARLNTMMQKDFRKEETKEGFEMAMDSVFGSNKKERKVDSQFSMKNHSSPLQVVGASVGQVNIVVVEPRTFEDSLEIVNHLKERKSVIVNLQHLDRELSQRVIDFVSGATLALDGTQERVGHGVFIFASINCQVQTESEGIRAYKDLFAKTFG